MKPFQRQDEFDVASYFAAYRPMAFEPGDLVQDACVRRQHVGLVDKGVLRISTLSRSGSERMLFFAHSGSILADTACFGYEPDIAQGVRIVAETASRVAFMPMTKFRQITRETPELAFAMLSRAHCKISTLVEQIEYASFHNTIDQVAALILALWREKQRHKNSSDYDRLLNVTHQMIAAATGRTRVSVTYALNRLRSQHAIELHRGSIEVTDPSVLARYIDNAEDDFQSTALAG